MENLRAEVETLNGIIEAQADAMTDLGILVEEEE